MSSTKPRTPTRTSKLYLKPSFTALPTTYTAAVAFKHIAATAAAGVAAATDARVAAIAIALLFSDMCLYAPARVFTWQVDASST